MFCMRCGAKIDDDSNFCKNCGARLTPSTGVSNESIGQNVSGYVGTPTWNGTVQQTAKSKKRVVIAVVAAAVVVLVVIVVLGLGIGRDPEDIIPGTWSVPDNFMEHVGRELTFYDDGSTDGNYGLRWSVLNGNILRLYFFSIGQTDQYEIVSISNTKMVLRNERTDETGTLRKN